MVGNLGARRWRWNPFIIDQDFKVVGGTFWERTVFLEGPKGTEHSGNFSCRLVINHNSRRHLKSLHVRFYLPEVSAIVTVAMNLGIFQ